MDEATRRHWEQVANDCFDRAYRSAQSKVASKSIERRVQVAPVEKQNV